MTPLSIARFGIVTPVFTLIAAAPRNPVVKCTVPVPVKVVPSFRL